MSNEGLGSKTRTQLAFQASLRLFIKKFKGQPFAVAALPLQSANKTISQPKHPHASSNYVVLQ